MRRWPRGSSGLCRQPAQQQLSSGWSFRCNDPTLRQFPLRIATAKARPAGLSWAPVHGTNCTGHRNRAPNAPPACRVTSNISLGSSLGASGNRSRPSGRNASNYTASGSVAAARISLSSRFVSPASRQSWVAFLKARFWGVFQVSIMSPVWLGRGVKSIIPVGPVRSSDRRGANPGSRTPTPESCLGRVRDAVHDWQLRSARLLHALNRHNRAHPRAPGFREQVEQGGSNLRRKKNETRCWPCRGELCDGVLFRSMLWRLERHVDHSVLPCAQSARCRCGAKPFNLGIRQRRTERRGCESTCWVRDEVLCPGSALNSSARLMGGVVITA